MALSALKCVCGASCENVAKLRAHRKECPIRPGQCPTCGRGKYRHRASCPDAAEDVNRRKLLAKHGIDLVQFEVFLRVMSRHYRGLSRVRLS